jgi:hypothetical protein
MAGIGQVAFSTLLAKPHGRTTQRHALRKHRQNITLLPPKPVLEFWTL